MAGIGTGVDQADGTIAAGAGPWSGMARAQYQALASMRWAMFRNSMRFNKGAVELGARVVAYVVYSVIGLGLAFGLGAGAYAMASDSSWSMMPLLFWVVFLVWQVLPISIASFQEQFDVAGLLRFPVAFAPYYLLHLIFGLIDISSILGGFCCVGMLVGITLARPTLFGWAALSLAGFAVFNVLLVRAIFAWIDRWLAQRRTREIVSGLFLAVMLSLQLLNPAFRSHKSWESTAQQRSMQMRWLQRANGVQQWLPPGLAAAGVDRAAAGKPVSGLGSLALLGVFMFGAGGVLAVRLRAEYRGENLSDAPSRSKAERRSQKWLIDGKGPIAAVMEKELRTLFRALPLLYGVGAPLLMVFVLSGLYRRGGSSGFAASFSLMVSLAYAMVGFTQMIYNNLGADGPGVQVMFLAPTPVRTVMLAKNLFHAMLFGVDAVLVCVLASLRLGPPSALTLTTTATWVLFALPVHLAAGNLLSLVMPYRVNLGRMTRQKGSQLSALVSLGIQMAVLGAGVGVYALCLWLGRPWVAAPVLLGMAVVSTSSWVLVLGRVDEIAARRREDLLGTLVRTD